MQKLMKYKIDETGGNPDRKDIRNKKMFCLFVILVCHYLIVYFYFYCTSSSFYVYNQFLDYSNFILQYTFQFIYNNLGILTHLNNILQFVVCIMQIMSTLAQ